MTLDDALNELGVDREADAEGARRAYLRLLKKRKPEVDPEGFMRLREAYESVKPYFEQIELFRAIEKAANTPATDDGSPQLIRIETPAGIVWVQKNDSTSSPADETNAEKPGVDEPAPAIVEANELPIPVEPPPVPAMDPVLLSRGLFSPVENPPQSELEEPIVKPQEPAEPSIDELIEQGKFKKAAQRMGAQYRSALQQGTFGVEVSAPHQAVMLLLRLHEKNRLEEARAFEKDFGEWLASTGASARILAGPLGVQWLIARELSALSTDFPPTLREIIAKSVIAGKLDEAKRRASQFQVIDPADARYAASELLTHAPTLADMLNQSLAPRGVHSAPVGSSSRGGTWGIGILLVVALNLTRLFTGSSNDSPSSYRGQTDPNAYYRPSPRPPANNVDLPTTPLLPFVLMDAGALGDESSTLDKTTRERLVNLTTLMETAADKIGQIQDRWVVQRLRYIRAAAHVGRCSSIQAETMGFLSSLNNLSPATKNALLTNAEKMEELVHNACSQNRMHLK